VPHSEFVLCKRKRLCYTQPRANDEFALFLGSSAVEHPTVNRMVAGSNPARGAKFRFIFNGLRQDSDLACDLVAANSQLDVYRGEPVFSAATPKRLN
jgi:hypothetical protein